ncbi:MAG: zinc-binding dehydrogenase [Actinomycetaceae bacterium]|nr:zinc-binding dehydrogenase [Actinomycetaceae bacterium]
MLLPESMLALTTISEGGLPHDVAGSLESNLGERMAVVRTGVPEPMPGEVLLRVEAAGVNRADVLQALGVYHVPQGASAILGLEAAGEVLAVGEGVDGGLVGSLRVALLNGGGQAQYCAVPLSLTLPVPVLPDRTDACMSGAALMESMATVQMAMDAAKACMPAGRGLTSVLVHGASGGVGAVAVQMARALGWSVVATAGDDMRCAKVEMLGAHKAVPYHDTAGIQGAVEEVTQGAGVDMVLDVMGAGGLELNTSAVSNGGVITMIGLLKGVRGEIDLGRLLAKNATVRAMTLRSQSAGRKAEIVTALGNVFWPAIEKGEIRPVIAGTVPFRRAEKAHSWILNKDVSESTDDQRPFGKIVLVQPW